VQLPIRIELHRSFFCRIALAASHGAALAAIAWPDWAPVFKAPLLVLILVLFAVAWRACVGGQHLVLGGDGQVLYQEKPTTEEQGAEVLSGTVVYPWLVVLRLGLDDGRRVTVVVWPDSTTAENFRRLCVWLRWKAAPSGNAPE